MCHWPPCWLTLHNQPKQAESCCQQPPDPQCKGCWHPPPELNGSNTIPTRSNDTKTRRRGSGWFRHVSRRASPTKAERREAPYKAPQGEVLGNLQQKDSDLIQTTRRVYFKMHHPKFNHEGLSRRWPPLLASWILKSMSSRRCGLDERTSRSLIMW